MSTVGLTGDHRNQPTALPLISVQSIRLVACIFWRASRALDRRADHNESRIRGTSRLAVPA